LKVSIDLPDNIYPGQSVEGTIKVEDELGIPKKGVDLTAVALNRQLNYTVPDLPYYGNTSSPRPRSESYDLEYRNKNAKKSLSSSSKLLVGVIVGFVTVVVMSS